MDALTLPLRSLIDPVGAIPRAVELRRWFFPLLLTALATAFSGAAIAMRLDPSPAVLSAMAEEGDLSKKSEREISEAIEQAQRKALVAGVASGVILVPLATLLGAVALRLAAWLIARKTTFAACFSVMALALFPRAVLHLIRGVVALKQPALTQSMLPRLLITSVSQLVDGVDAKWTTVLSGLDVFALWSALVLGLGFSAATAMSRPRGVLFGFFLYVLFFAFFFVGLPGLGGGSHGGHR